MKALSGLEAALARAAGHLCSAAGRRNRGLLVLIYHRVLPVPDPLRRRTPVAATFAAQMDLLAGCFNVLPLSEALERVESRSLPPRALSVTFDDGYADNLTVAAPIMAERGIRATVFVATGYLDGGLMFNDAITEALRGAPERFDLADLGLGVLELPDVQARRTAIMGLIDTLKYQPAQERNRLSAEIIRRAGLKVPRDLMLASSQVRGLRDAGMEIGAHTATHPILTRVAPSTARDDIARGKHELEAILGDPVSLFAYPNGRPGGDYDATHVSIVQDLGFQAAFSTAWGAVHAGSARFQLPRVAPWDDSSRAYAGRLVRSYLERSARVA